MIRRDYILRMIEQCIQALTQSLRLLQERRFQEAHGEADRAIQALTGTDTGRLLALAQSELLALLIQGQPTQVLRQKCMLLSALLSRAAEIYGAEGQFAESRLCRLKALNLQLEVLLREGVFEYPEFVPRVEALVSVLGDEPLPAATTAALMQYYESSGQFAKAEDAFFALLETKGASRRLIEFGEQFYRRLAAKADEALELGNLPRAELEAGLAELASRRAEL